jgi:hypothetical protein
MERHRLRLTNDLPSQILHNGGNGVRAAIDGRQVEVRTREWHFRKRSSVQDNRCLVARTKAWVQPKFGGHARYIEQNLFGGRPE